MIPKELAQMLLRQHEHLIDWVIGQGLVAMTCNFLNWMNMKHTLFSSTLAILAGMSLFSFTNSVSAGTDGFIVFPPPGELGGSNPVITTPGQLPGVNFFVTNSYLSRSDIPKGFYLNDQPTFLDDLEDQSLGGGLSSGGIPIGCLAGFTNGCSPASVDEDDGAINAEAFGFFLAQAGTATVSVSSGPLPTAFALAITSGNPFATVTFTAFDGQGANLGTVSYSGSVFFNTPNTARARFVGVQYDGGIQRVEVDAATSIAYDHVQYGTMATPVPEPQTYALMLAGLGLVGFMARRRVRKF